MITVLFALQLPKLKPDFEFEKFFPVNDPDISFYQKHLKNFSYDNDYLSIIIENKNGVFDSLFFTKIADITGHIQELEGVESVYSPLDLLLPIKGPMGITPIPVIHSDQPDRYFKDSINTFNHPVFSQFFGRDGKSLLLQVAHKHFQSPEASSRLSKQITNRLDEMYFDNTRMIGKLIAQDAFIAYIQNDFMIFMIAALGVSFLLLVMIFKSFKVALLPYLISVTALIWVLGLMAWLGYPITILGSLIPPVILFVSSSDAIHLINSFRDNLHHDYTSNLKRTVHKVFMPTLLTSATTAIGFFSLITLDTLPIRHLGIFTGIGVLMAFGITFLFAPLLLSKSYLPKQPARFPKWWPIWVLRNQRRIYGLFVCIAALALIGAFSLKVDAGLLDDLPNESEVRKDFEFADVYYQGSKPWELAYWPKDTSQTIWNEHVMFEAEKIHEYLSIEYPIQRLASPATIMRFGNQMLQGGLNAHFDFPLRENYEKTFHQMGPILRSNTLPKLYSEDEKYARFTGFIPEYGSHFTMEKNKDLLQFLDEHINHNVLIYRLTGTTYLIDKSHELLSFNLIKGLFIGILMISLILIGYFKSFKMLTISILPNIIPLLVTAGYMAAFGITLKLTTAIIFTVTFGIAVDDTIHFITVYQRVKAQNPIYRLIHTFHAAGMPIVITSVIIVAGFGLFIFSSFGATHYLGLFMVIALVVALITDLTLLPLLLHHFGHKKSA